MNSDTSVISPNLKPAPPLPVWKRTISFPVALAVLLAGGIFVPLRSFWVDPDIWWHIKAGATILSTHRWPTMDTYSYTAYGTHWIAYQWLGEVVLAIFANLWGLRGLMALDLILAAAIIFALYALVTQRCGNCKAAFMVCALFLPLVYSSFSLRPQMIAYLFLVLTLIILERFRQGRTGTLWLLPPLFLVWINTHGIFTLGLFALGVYWASGLVEIHWGDLESRRWTTRERVRLELVGLLSLVALTITPYGADLLLYPLDMAFSQPINMANIIEWQPMMFDKAVGKIFLVFILSFLLAQVTLRPRWRLEELVLLFAGITGASLHLRMVLAFVSFSAPLFGVILARWVPPHEPARDKYALNAILMTLVAAAVIGFFPSRTHLESIMEQKWPVRAVEYLRQHPAPKPMLNSYAYGGYLIWQMADANKVFIDGRGDIYERTGVFADYLHIARLEFPAPFLLRAYSVQSCLLERNEILVTLLAASPNWQKAYGGQLSVLYVRRPRPAREKTVASDK
ncbi:MAG: hypothetical protein WAO35_17310 [Terriglobia bacterium]